jgi:DNA polymerase elongation subunit (family B)
MDFYTNIQVRGNDLLIRGYENGQAIKAKHQFQPTLYVDATRALATEWKTLDGVPVHPMQPGTIRDCRDFIQRYENVEGFKVYGNTHWNYQFISETFPNEIPWDRDLIKTYSLDIETATESGFPDIETANEEILLITLQDNFTKRITTFGLWDYTTNDPMVDYHCCLTEEELLRKFMKWWRGNYPDVITGWNIEFFDVPYLIRRITNMLGEDTAKQLSPWNYINEKRIQVKGSEEISYDISGVSALDYLDLYKKYTYTTQESYKLDHIAYVELGDKKKENPGNSFKEFYTDYWKDFVDYNIHDVRLVDMLEDKMRLIELQ